ncbi:MAG: lysophospholipase [Deltaproteobacteria bacterium]|nr:lysophospholipase [Deltaproteobacteria bacterium]
MLHSDSLVVQGSESSNTEVPLFVDCWQGRSGAGRTLLIVHGMGEHGGRYAHVPKFLGEDFERFYAMDQRGHGRSGGLRGYAPNFDTYVEDLKRVVDEILKERAVPFEAAIISAPLRGVSLKVPAYKKALGELLGRTLSKVQLTNEVNPSYLSHDPAIVEAYVKDRLVHAKITPRLYLDMTAAMDWVNAQSGPLACPTLFLVPGDDRVVSSATTVAFFRNLKYREKDLREYPGMFHEVMNEIGKEKVFEDIRKWLAPKLNN